MKLERKNKNKSEISTSSLPDIIFMLLIFFMVTTVMREFEGLDVVLPRAKTIEKLESKRHTSYIWSTKDGLVSVDDKLVNRSFLVGPKGEILYKYDKIHLYDVNLPNGDVYRESDTYKSGNKAIIAEIKKNRIKIGLTICYDLRFPHLYQDLAVNGAEIIVVPSAFSNLTGPVHWHTLLKARAIETGAFIIAPAQTGCHECGRTSYGHSLIISPWGEVLKDAKEEIGIIHANINLDEVMKARRAIPALNSRKDYLTNF